MKRFAEKRDVNNVIPLRDAVCDVDVPYWRITRSSSHESFLYGDAVDRLAAYEDTGYTPEEVAQMGAALKMQALMVQEAYAIWNAQQEGRVIVLPCRVGDTVFVVEGHGVYKSQVDSITLRNDGLWVNGTFNHFGLVYFSSEIGRNVFITREEAEAALEAKK